MSLDKQIETWRTKLLDLSRRNPLLNCRIGERGAIEIVYPDNALFWTNLVLEEKEQVLVWRSMLLSQKEQDELAELPDEQDEHSDESNDPDSDSDAKAEADRAKAKAEESNKLELEKCLKSKKLRKNHLLTPLRDPKLKNRLKTIARTGKESLSEQGTHSLYAAFGILRWTTGKAGDPFYQAPIFLVPISLDRKSLKDPWIVSVAENDPAVNMTLIEFLKNDYGLILPPFEPSDSDTSDTSDASEPDSVDDWSAYLETVRNLIAENPREELRGWEVKNTAVLGSFRFQKLAMWHDLQANRDRIGQHPICRAIAGEQDEKIEYPELPDASRFDEEIHPKEVFAILDSDSSQYEAIQAVKSGLDLVLDGPPGAGKSQTISNIIAEVIAEGKTVLFVSEKAAALQVVKSRLEKNNLGDFCLDCHNVKRNKKAFIEEIAACLDLPGERYAEKNAEFERLYQIRKKLNGYVEALHKKHGPMEFSAYFCHSRLAALKDLPVLELPIKDPIKVEPDQYRAWMDLFQKFSALKETIAQGANHPWHSCKETELTPLLPDRVAEDLKQLRSAIETVLPALNEIIQLKIIREVPNRMRCQQIAELLQKLLDCPPLTEKWFDHPEELVQKIDRMTALMTQYDEDRKQLRQSREDRILALELPALTESLELIRQTARNSPGAPMNLAELIEHLGQRDELVAKLTKTISEMQRCFSDLKHAYEFSLDDQSDLSILSPALTALAEYFAAKDQPTENWLNPDTRRNMVGVLDRCVEKERSFQSEILSLGKHYAADLHSPDVEALVEQTPRFRSFFSRMPWSGPWRRFQREVRALFRPNREPATGRDLMDRMETLLKLYCTKQDVESAVEPFLNEIPRNSSGTPDRTLLADQLKRLDQVFGAFHFNEAFRELLLKKSPAQTDSIRRELTRCSEIAQECIKGFTELRDLFGRFRPPERVMNLSSYSLDHIHRIIQDALQWTARWKETVEPLSELDELVQSSDDQPDTFGQLQRKIELAVRLVESTDALTDLWRDLSARLGEKSPTQELSIDLLQTRAKSIPFTVSQWETIRKQGDGLKAITKAFKPEALPQVVPLVTEEANRQVLKKSYDMVRNFLGSELKQRWDRLAEMFDPAARWEEKPLDEMAQSCSLFLDNISTLPDQIRLNELIQQTDQLGFQLAFQQLREEKIESEQLPKIVEKRFLTLFLQQAWKEDPRLTPFDSLDHEKLIEEFRTLDRSCIGYSPGRIRSELLDAPTRPHTSGGLVSRNSELGIINREKEKKRRHLSIRQVFEKCPTIMMKIKPCLMMSPLAVSTMLQSEHYQFDLVIFDEASQVFPYDAIGAIYRGKQLVVAGDQKQLPPSNYFNRTSEGDIDEDSDEIQIDDYSSILDVAHTIGLPSIRLKWHYRSRREPLIAFSNHYFYNDDLVTFPSVYDTDEARAVEFHHVPNGVWTATGKSGRGSACNPIEAEATAKLVISHFQNQPDRSLGVITCNIRQQAEVENAIEKLRKNYPELDPLFSDDQPEPFFVKNLETVQGDERDFIFFGVGYAPDKEGVMRMNFGPLNKEGGERRLNVAVTRARYQVCLISSIGSDMIDLKRTKSVGAQRLKEYIEYAEKGPRALAQRTARFPKPTESSLEAQVMTALQEEGMTVRTQVGCSGFRIDLALSDPDQPDRFVLGIECDGDSYRYSNTARDRDRLRRDVLMGLGWNIVQLWSSDWMMDSKKQVQRIIRAYRQALEQKDTEAPASPASVPKKPVEEPVIIERKPLKTYQYSHIDEVKPKVIRDCLIEQYERSGLISREDLILIVSKQLGFKKIGARIREKIGKELDGLLAKKTIVISD